MNSDVPNDHPVRCFNSGLRSHHMIGDADQTRLMVGESPKDVGSGD